MCMRNYEVSKFVDTYVRTTNDKGKQVKLQWKKADASKAELDEVVAKLDPAYMEAWKQYLKKAQKDFKEQSEIETWRAFLAEMKKPGKKLERELGLPLEKIII